MKTRRAWQNRTLLFRLYLLLALGLVAVAALLDVGFRELQGRLNPEADAWRSASLDLVAAQLAKAAPGERTQLAAALTDTLGMPVQLLAAADIAGSAPGAGETRELFDADGRVTLIRHDRTHDLVIRIGPAELPEPNPWLKLVPPLFYVAIFLLVGWWLRPLLKDLDVITTSTRAFAADYREPRATEPTVTSLKELARNFDAMASRLSALIQGQKELTSALSHEMRTPLARIRFALAVLGDKAGDAEREELTAIGGDVQEIDRLIATMLDYARLDHPDTRMDLQDVPVEAWIADTVQKSRLPDVDVRWQAGEGVVTLPMDRRLMTLALSNLLVNACRHAKSRVAVSLTAANGDCCLQVEDDGEGIPEADRARVFKAFTRLDSSRNRDTGGSGLGLAVVARIAHLHGGNAAASRSGQLGGASLTVSWPAGH